MIDKPLSAITAADLQRLIDDEVGARKTLDYKRDLPGNSRANTSINTNAGYVRAILRQTPEGFNVVGRAA